MNQDVKDIKAIFSEALEKPTDDERSAYLGRVCGDDAGLRDKIENLLKAHNKVGTFLEPSEFKIEAAQVLPLTEQPGTIIGRYKLLEQIGEGGMAIVYMAEQQEPIRRKVALKIIKLGMDTKSVIARFEAERQALAMMDHPNIAKVLDAGATETGRPYFVMELVKGASITDFCDANNLSTHERLKLFVQVCQAVQHAHQKGIIHRDIKPTNVMVTLHDGEPSPKVIDFGIAKAVNQKLTEKTLFTRYAQIIGTPVYMSPEQAELNDMDIDTRTDIYSLGILLYELLTGTTPFDANTLREAGYAEMQRIIREEEPAKPSTKISTMGEAQTDIAKRRQTNPDLLQKQLRTDLDWIVMKSLEKDRTRRYDSAGELGTDIERHLKNEPVLAGPPSVLYKTGKFIRRHHTFVAGLVTVITAVSASLVGMAVFAQKADRARNEAVATADYLQQDILGALDPWLTTGREAILEDVLQESGQTLTERFQDQPLVEASIRKPRGVFFRKLGRMREAEPELQRALELYQQVHGHRAVTTLEVQNELGHLYHQWHRHREAIAILEQVTETARQTLGPDHPLTLTASVNLGAVYTYTWQKGLGGPLLEKTLTLAQQALGSEHEITLECLYALSEGAMDVMPYLAAERCRKALEIGQRVDGPEHPRTLHYQAVYARTRLLQERYQQAQAQIEPVLKIVQQNLGAAHRETIYSMVILAWALNGQQRDSEAEALLRRAIEIRRQQAPTQPDWLDPWCELAEWLRRRNRLAEAESLLQEALDLNRQWWGKDHFATVGPTFYQGVLYRIRGRYDQAEILLREAFERSRFLKGPWMLQTTRCLFQLLYLYYSHDRFGDLSALYEDQITWLRQYYPGAVPGYLKRWSHFLATFPNPAWRNGERALELAREAWDYPEQSKQHYCGYYKTLAAAHAELGDFPAAVSFQKKAIAAAEAKPWQLIDLPRLYAVLHGYQSGRPSRRCIYRQEHWIHKQWQNYPWEMAPITMKEWENCRRWLDPYHLETWLLETWLSQHYQKQKQPNRLKAWIDELISVHNAWPARPEGVVSYDPEGYRYTLKAAGADIGNVTDEFLFVPKTLHGDGSITACIETIETVHEQSKVGLMIRDTMEPWSAHVSVCMTPTSDRVTLLHRGREYESTLCREGLSDDLTFPHWIRLKRQGNRFRAQHSKDGEHWSDLSVQDPNIPTTVEVPMNETVTIGLVLSPWLPDRCIRAQIAHVSTTGDVTPAGPFTESVDINLRTRSGE